MKKSARFAAILITLCSALMIALSAGGAYAFDVNGIWKGDNSTFIFYQEGQTIKVMCSYRWENRQPIVWFGEGKLEGDRVSYRLHHTANLAPAGWEDGIHEFVVSPDNASMSGTWKTVSGSASGRMPPLHKVGP